MTSPTDGSERSSRGGPPLLFALVGLAGILLGGFAIVAGAMDGAGGDGGEGPAAPPATLPAPGQASASTRELLIGVLGEAGLQVTDPQAAFRPGETPALLAAPRRVIQVILPDDRARGHIVIYELGTTQSAERVGQEFARYLASGPGAIQYPNDARFVLRRVDTTLVFYQWSPLASADERAAGIEEALQRVGEGIRVS